MRKSMSGGSKRLGSASFKVPLREGARSLHRQWSHTCHKVSRGVGCVYIHCSFARDSVSLAPLSRPQKRTQKSALKPSSLILSVAAHSAPPTSPLPFTFPTRPHSSLSLCSSIASRLPHTLSMSSYAQTYASMPRIIAALAKAAMMRMLSTYALYVCSLRMLSAYALYVCSLRMLSTNALYVRVNEHNPLMTSKGIRSTHHSACLVIPACLA